MIHTTCKIELELDIEAETIGRIKHYLNWFLLRIPLGYAKKSKARVRVVRLINTSIIKEEEELKVIPIVEFLSDCTKYHIDFV
jgi:hypothetical protein